MSFTIASGIINPLFYFERRRTTNVGIIGLHGSGKTTIFNSLTGHMVHPDSVYGKKGCALGLTQVPDKRLDTLSSIFKPEKTVYAQICFIDFPGSAKDEKGFSDQTLRKIHETDALALVLRGFLKGMEATPLEDLRTVMADMLVSDLILTENALQRLRKERKDPRLCDIMTRIHQHLSCDRWLTILPLEEQEENAIAGYTFVTRKPMLIVLNSGETTPDDIPLEKIAAICTEQGWEFLTICGSMEEEITQLASNDQGAFLADLGVEEPASHRFIRASYRLLDLISFFTIGENDVRSWPIKRGTRAQRAAGKVHSDMERGFIRAEVIGYEDFILCGDFAVVRKKGLLRLEGKEYCVRDGDIIFFRFNV